MDINYYEQTLRDISLSMFRKSFFGIFHGSISARIDGNKFLINKEDAIFDNLKSEDLVLLYNKKDYRWKNASSDSDIHLNIYANIKEAKFVCYAMPPYLVSYTFNHDFIIPKDYFSYIKFKKVEIYNPKSFDDWYERANSEIYQYMLNNKTDIMVIRGYGVYAYARSASALAKKIALLENSCKLLNMSHFN